MSKHLSKKCHGCQLEDVHQMPQKSIMLAMPIPRWRCFFLFGNMKNEPEVNLYKGIIHNQQESSHSVFSRLYEFFLQDVIFLRCPINIAPNLEEFLFSKPFRGFPFAKMRMGTEGFTRCKPQPREKSLLSKVDERFQNGNWRLATQQMRA